MLSLMEKIKNDRQVARVEHDAIKVNLLSTVVGDIERKYGKCAISDSDVVSVLKKFVEGIDLSIDICGETEQFITEKKILESFLPKQLSETDICGILISSGCDSVQSFMKHMKEKYAGQYDGKIASSVAKKTFV